MELTHFNPEGRIYPGDAIVIKKECGDEVH